MYDACLDLIHPVRLYINIFLEENDSATAGILFSNLIFIF